MEKEAGFVNPVTLARNAMATRFEIVLHGGDPAALRAAGEEALDESTAWNPNSASTGPAVRSPS